jgi:hypothetical protein
MSGCLLFWTTKTPRTPSDHKVFSSQAIYYLHLCVLCAFVVIA